MTGHASTSAVAGRRRVAALLFLAAAQCAIAAPAPAALQEIEIAVPGTMGARGLLALPSSQRAPAVLLLHDWRGMTPAMTALARSIADDGYVVLAADLFAGKLPRDPAEARALLAAIPERDGVAMAAAWVDLLATHPRGTGAVAAIGWGMGATWGLRAAAVAPVGAVVLFDGRLDLAGTSVRALRAPVLAHLAKRDPWAAEHMAAAFAASAGAAGKVVTVLRYDAERGFAVPGDARYRPDEARRAWRATWRFIESNMRGAAPEPGSASGPAVSSTAGPAAVPAAGSTVGRTAESPKILPRIERLPPAAGTAVGMPMPAAPPNPPPPATMEAPAVPPIPPRAPGRRGPCRRPAGGIALPRARMLPSGRLRIGPAGGSAGRRRGWT